MLERAYGMADLEHDVPNRPDTIFEAGSVSKQFTAAAVLLLARDGKLSLDDDVRKYIPEVPDYGTPITIRQMLQHTSGLRDWGSVEDVAGWPRGTRVYTHAHVLDIASRQSRLNFPPGTDWSYTNTGYNLAAILVSRASGQSFADFTRERIFEPLGMTRTSWRDDFARIVKDRAVAYAEEDGRYRMDMPFEDIHGNGGLLTTVGDLLRWNANFDAPTVGDAAFVAEETTPGRLADGTQHDYAFGLSVGRYKGLREIRHSGTTGSYRAYLSRLPDQRLSVAVLCNAGNSTPGATLHAVADLYLGAALKPDPGPKSVALSAAALDALVGLYRNAKTGDVIRLTREGGALNGGGMPLVALSPRRFMDGDDSTIEFDGRGGATLDYGNGTSARFERVEAAHPAPAALTAFAGAYTSADAETTLKVAVQDGSLVIHRRPDGVFPLAPLYADAFGSDLGTVVFRRDGRGRPAGFSLVRDRVWDLRFRREDADARRILAFGDSNTWGWIPVANGFPTTRYPADVRWPGIAQAALGEGYEIVEEGLSGRTTDLADPTVPQIAGAGLDGSAYLPAAVASHLPLDLVVIMLGTNDLKASFDRSPEEIAGGVRKLVGIVKSMQGAAWTEYPAPEVLVVAPTPLAPAEKFPAEVFAGGLDKSRALAVQYAAAASAAGAEFLDAGAVTPTDGIDGLHLGIEAHRRLGLAIARKVKEMLE